MRGPEREHQPGPATARPVRNGRTSTSALRASISPPTATSATGATYAAAPIAPRGRLGDPLADEAARPAEVEQAGEEEAERDEPEADELRMVVAAG